MGTATSTEAGRAVVMMGNDPQLRENASAKLARKQAEARAAADALNGRRADVTTPLIGAVPLATIPEPPHAPAPKAEKTARRFSLQTTIAYRNRAITIVAEGLTLDEFCDLMDDRGYSAPAPLLLSAPLATPDDLPDGYKLCRKHGAPMKPRSKQGDVWNSHNVGTADKPCWCKGYAGPDSPGYEVG